MKDKIKDNFKDKLNDNTMDKMQNNMKSIMTISRMVWNILKTITKYNIKDEIEDNLKGGCRSHTCDTYMMLNMIEMNRENGILVWFALV